jgi:nucleoid-associated protein YgaU
MALAKLKILVLNEHGNSVQREIHALYNPGQVSLSKSANWCSAPTAGKDTGTTQFTHGEPATLRLELFFDTYETDENVEDYTQQVYDLTTIEKHGNMHRPPVCRLVWGSYSFGDFLWVVTSLTQTFTLFREDGTPVRATLSCDFRQWRSEEMEKRAVNLRSPDVAKTRVVRRGETLSGIAGEVYANPALWRPIALANGIDNPRRLEPGKTLLIPVLAAGSGARR